MDLGLKGKVAIVAASSKGMGKATAMALAAEGSRVTVLARDEAELRRAAEEIGGRHDAEVLAVPADVTRADDIQRVVRQTVERWGTVHVLVNNAGGPPGGVFDDVANMIVFLASDRARYVTGVTVQVDGGLVRSML